MNPKKGLPLNSLIEDIRFLILRLDVINLKFLFNMLPEPMVFHFNLFGYVIQTRTLGHNDCDLVFLIYR